MPRYRYGRDGHPEELLRREQHDGWYVEIVRIFDMGNSPPYELERAYANGGEYLGEVGSAQCALRLAQLPSKLSEEE